MNKIDLNQILKSVDELLYQKISIIITSFKEPKTEKAIKQALNQKTKYDYEIIVSAPDKETLDIARKYAKKNKKVIAIKDPGKGKSFALNFLFEKIKSNIVIITDGDVFMNEFAVEELVNDLLDPEIGCVSGRPVPMEDKKTKYGYWANFLFEAAHRMRRNAANNEEFLECSAYLLAFRRDRLDKIPVDVAEDAYIPYYFWERGYRIGYNDKAKVYVKNVDNWRDWVKQKVRTSKAHETLNKYVNVKMTPRAKTFANESKGITWAFEYPKNIKETLWMLELIFARGYMWTRVFFDTKLKNKHYGDAWERVESAR
jgi:cellulose synthase/poly-beta-1,6-N-acetylglucosamine synthase-like glycosyltransferase